MEFPAERQLRWILRRSATLLSYGAEPVRGLVTPTSEFFPDAFDRSPASVAKLLARIQGHAGLKSADLSLSIVTPDGEEIAASSCKSGACNAKGLEGAGTLRRLTRNADGSYAASIAANEVGHPGILTTALVRAVSAVFVAESGAADEVPSSELEVLVDLAAVWLGFGVLVTNGSYVYMKGCGGVSILHATKMPTEEIAVALALFCSVYPASGGSAERTASRHLEPTPREHFAEGMQWARSNRRVVAQLQDDPALVERDTFTLRERSTWLGRVLGLGKRSTDALPSSDELSSLEASLKARAALPSNGADAAKRKRLAEIRALVDESFE